MRWRIGGNANARRKTVTVYEEHQAKDFKFLVDRAGQQWPSDEELRTFRLDFLCREPEPDVTEELDEPITCEEYFSMYVECVIESGTVKGYERKKYRQRLRDHVIPYIGHIAIAELTKADLRQWQNALAARGNKSNNKANAGKGLSSTTIRNVRGSIVAPALECACDEDNDFGLPKVRDASPLTRVKVPKKRRVYKPIIEDEVEAALLIEGMYATGSKSLGDLVSSVLCGS
ncbi:MAG: hypothetical protein ACRDXX_06220, partial [Stackebrandtia sp.]